MNKENIDNESMDLILSKFFDYLVKYNLIPDYAISTKSKIIQEGINHINK